jgi:hypothetical protein
MRSPLALIALIALCVSVGARADTDEPFNGAVHSDPGVDAVPDDGMTEEAHAVQWIDVEMNGDIFVTRKSWQPPQYHLEDDTYVRMRGWVSTIRAAAAGEAVFRLPEDARPGRAEPWKVSMKGTDREILLGKFILIIVTRTGNLTDVTCVLCTGEDGVARLLTDIPADNWIPLAGFAFNSWRAAGGDAAGGAPKAELSTGSTTFEEVELPKDEL